MSGATVAVYRSVDALSGTTRPLADVAELRQQLAQARRDVANHYAAAEAERVASARLRSQNQKLAAELATAKALNTQGRAI